MRYRNVVIKCKKKDTESLQKYLFKLKYHWNDNGTKHRHVKNFDNRYVDCEYIYFIIKNDTSFSYIYYNPTNDKLQLLEYPKFIRKEKLIKLNKV